MNPAYTHNLIQSRKICNEAVQKGILEDLPILNNKNKGQTFKLLVYIKLKSMQSLIKLILKHMQSGTLLHLALLRKLSSRQNRKTQGSRINRFRTFSRFSRRDAACSQRTSTPRKPLEKYASCESVFNFVGRSQPNRWKREGAELQGDVTGWSLQNEQKCNNYEHKLKKNKYNFFDGEISKSRKDTERRNVNKKFTFCEDNIDYIFQKSNKKRQLKPPLAQTNKTITPFVILDAQTEPTALPPTKHILINKQNLSRAQFQLISPSPRPKLPIKSNQTFRINKNSMKTQRKPFKHNLIC